MESQGLFRICGFAKWNFLAPLEVKGFMVHHHLLLNTNLKYFMGFLSYFSILLVPKSVLNLLHNLATVMRQRQSTLMAKPTELSRFDKVL